MVKEKNTLDDNLATLNKHVKQLQDQLAEEKQSKEKMVREHYEEVQQLQDRRDSEVSMERKERRSNDKDFQ